MKNVNIRESNLPNIFKIGFETDLKISGPNNNAVLFKIQNVNNEIDQKNDCVYPFAAFIEACASVMSTDVMKSKEHKTALVFSDPKGAGNMLMACISEWIPANDGDGNYNFYFSFDPDDIKGLPEDRIHNFYNLQDVKSWGATIKKIIASSHGRCIDDDQILTQMSILIVKSLYNWLDENASEDTVVSLTIDEDPTYYNNDSNPADKLSYEDYLKRLITYAVATVEIVKGKKIKSMTFGEEMKAIAKGNADLT
jgi:hypothetical protein